jgi:hypothetical protein
MAHRLAKEGSSGSGDTPEEESTDENGKLLLNRRKYVKLGATATATLLVGGGAISASGDENTNTYWTDFSEGQL